jgi:MFS family permease
MRAPAPPDLATRFLRYSFARGLCGRGYWLAASIYLVVVADLTPAELLLIGAAQAITVLVAEVPAGVFADTVSRRLSLVVACGTSGVGMVMAGLVTSFPALVVSQMLWGLGWAFASGSDVAWITDELDRSDLIDRLLAARARWELLGAAAGVLASGLIALATDLATSVVLFGLFMIGLGLYIGRVPESGFTPAPADQRWRQATAIARGGLGLVRRDREVLLVVVAWLFVNGGEAGYGRLVEQQVIGTDLSVTEAIVWFSALGLAVLVVSAVLLRVVEHHIDRPATARRAFLAACASGTVGLLVFAHAPDRRYALAAVVLASGAVHPGSVVRAVAEIWVNRRTSSAVRATVHSLLSQSEHLGELVFGLGLAALAQSTTGTTSITASAALIAVACLVISRPPRLSGAGGDS